MTKTKKVIPPSACLPPDYAISDAAAIQALSKGEATPEMQKRALAWVVNHAAGTYDLSFRPGFPDETSFAEGRRFVGLEIVKLLHLNLTALINKGIK